jgi:carbonic anhydrase
MASPAAPSKQHAVVACMDARLMPAQLLGFSVGDAHVIRNAGGVVTNDVLRSLALSQRVLGTTDVSVIHHTGCGMLRFDDDSFRRELEAETGVSPAWDVKGHADLDTGVREAIARIRDCAFLPHRDAVRGFAYDVDTGELREVA